MTSLNPGRTPNGIDFNVLEEKALWQYIAHHGIQNLTPPAPSRAVLAAACARHFRAWQVDEDAILRTFCGAVDSDFNSRELEGAVRFRKRARPTGDASLPSAKAIARDPLSPYGHTTLKQGEKVAAKVTPTDENGSWILAAVMRYFPNLDRYEVADEDDSSRKFVVDSHLALRLSDNIDGLHKGCAVLAMFPETTSFYRAKVAKALKRGATEALVQFEDDEDETGKTPNRRIAAKFVFPMPH